jgi:RNA 3'-terminal phosphate cyclase (ATP)
MIEIDGSRGEGGGQILRSSLALSVVTGTPVAVHRIRAARREPGLRAQHLAAVRAAAAVGAAKVEGDHLGSTSLVFEPTAIVPGAHRFAVGTAGSAGLVLQTVLPPLLRAAAPSELVLEGGTHNPSAPPFPFLARCFLPLLSAAGPSLSATLERAGFYPRGGGRFSVRVEPGPLGRIDLPEPGRLTSRRAVATVARLPAHIVERELATLKAELALKDRELEREVLPEDQGPGNACRLELAHERLTLVFTGFGEKGRPAEEVAHGLAKEVRRWQRAKVAVDAHLADQLLLPLALGEGGRFTTTAPSLHARTHAEVIRRFLDRDLRFEQVAPDRWLVTV